jgi:hypothetical protein
MVTDDLVTVRLAGLEIGASRASRPALATTCYHPRDDQNAVCASSNTVFTPLASPSTQ